MAGTGAGILTSLKNKMQHLREELEKYKDMYDEKCQELEEEKARRNEVGVTQRAQPLSDSEVVTQF